MRWFVWVLACTPVFGSDAVIFTGTATVEQSCGPTFQVTSGFRLTVHLDHSILPLDASRDSGVGHYDGLVQSWSFSRDDPALSFWSGTFKGTGEVNIANDQEGRDRGQVRSELAGVTNFTALSWMETQRSTRMIVCDSPHRTFLRLKKTSFRGFLKQNR